MDQPFEFFEDFCPSDFIREAVPHSGSLKTEAVLLAIPVCSNCRDLQHVFIPKIIFIIFKFNKITDIFLCNTIQALKSF